MRQPSRRGCHTLALMAFLAVAANAAALPVLSDYTVTSWTRRDGLPAGSVWSICQDNDGYIWLGTTAGLLRFDGVRFVSWETLGGPALPGDSVTAMTTSRDGSLWLGFTGGGIARVVNKTVTVYREPENLALVRMLFEDSRGVLWASGRSGVFRFVNGRWEHLGVGAGLLERPSQLHEDRSGVLWVSSGPAVFRQVADGRFEATRELPHLIALARERLTSATESDTRSVPISFERALEDHNGNVWVTTLGQGLWRIKAALGRTSIEHMTTDTGLSSDAIGTLFEDHDHNIWIGTLSGLQQLTPRTVTAVRNIGQPISIDTTTDGSVWIGTARGLVRSKDGRLKTNKNRLGIPNWDVRAIARDRDGRLWIVLSDGIVRFEHERFSRLELPAGMHFGRISAAAVDSQGRLWLCDYFLGILQWSHGQVSRFTQMAGANGQTAMTILADRDDRIWIGFAGGRVGVVDADGRFTARDVNQRARIIGNVSSLAEGTASPNGGRRVLWVGTSGILRLAGDELVAITDRNGWPSAKVHTIVDDGQAAVWATTNIGLIRIDKDEFDRVAAAATHRIRYKLYDDTDGLEGGTSIISSRGAARAADGRLWFITDAGAMVVDPATLKSPLAAPKVRIEEIRVGAERFESPTNRLMIPPGAARLEIDYTALTFVSPRSVRFEYRLDGFDTEWTDAGTRRQAIYTNLAPGNYRFQVKAHDKEGSTSMALVAFVIQPPFYRRPWFAALVFSAVIGLLVAAWRIRINQVRARFALVVAERARISREVHDTLIQSLVAVAVQVGAVAEQLSPDARGIREQLSAIRRQAEEQIREARESIWNLRSPTLERLGLVSALRQSGDQVARQGSFRFSMTVSGQVRPCPPAVEAQLLRIGREALTNVWQHARATEVRMELTYERDRVLLRVSDNGIGFDPDAPDLEARAHTGLMSMTERAYQFGGELTIISGQGRGTEVVATFPSAANEAA